MSSRVPDVPRDQMTPRERFRYDYRQVRMAVPRDRPWARTTMGAILNMARRDASLQAATDIVCSLRRTDA